MARGDKNVTEVTLPGKEALTALVEEINAVLQPKTPIVIGRKMTDEAIIEAIKREATGNIYEIDFQPDPNDPSIEVFSEEGEATIKALGIEILPGAPPTADEGAESAEGVEIADTPSAPAPADKKDTKKDTKKDDTPKDPAEKRYTRDCAVCDFIEANMKTGFTFKECMDGADDLYVKSGGKSVPDAVNVNKYCLNGLVHFGVLSLVDGKYTAK